MVLDRDYRDDASVTDLEKRLKDRVAILKYNEIESILLEANHILTVLANSGVESLKSAHDVQNALMRCAKSLEDLFIAQWAAYRLHSKLTPKDDEKDPRPTQADNVIQMAEAMLKRSQSAFSPDAVLKQIENARVAVGKSFTDGTWVSILPGKEILRNFR